MSIADVDLGASQCATQDSETHVATLELSLVTAHKRVIRAEGEATLSREELRSHSLAIAGLEAEVSESVARWEQETLLRMQAEERARGLEQEAHQALANEAAALEAVDEGVAAQQVLLKQIGQLRELKVASRQLKVCSLCPGCDGSAAKLCTDVSASCTIPYMLQCSLSVYMQLPHCAHGPDSGPPLLDACPVHCNRTDLADNALFTAQVASRHGADQQVKVSKPTRPLKSSASGVAQQIQHGSNRSRPSSAVSSRQQETRAASQGPVDSERGGQGSSHTQSPDRAAHPADVERLEIPAAVADGPAKHATTKQNQLNAQADRLCSKQQVRTPHTSAPCASPVAIACACLSFDLLGTLHLPLFEEVYNQWPMHVAAMCTQARAYRVQSASLISNKGQCTESPEDLMKHGLVQTI